MPEARCFGGEAIEKVGGGMEGVDPVRRRKIGLEEEAADDVVCGADHTLCSTVLGRGVWP